MKYEITLVVLLIVVIATLLQWLIWYSTERKKSSLIPMLDEDKYYPKAFHSVIENLEKRIKTHKLVQENITRNLEDLDEFVRNVNIAEKENFPRIKNIYSNPIQKEIEALTNKLERFKQFGYDVFEMSKVVMISDLSFNASTESIYFKIKREQLDLFIQHLEEKEYCFITNPHLTTKPTIKVRIGTHRPDDVSFSELQDLKEGKLIYTSLLVENKYGKSWL